MRKIEDLKIDFNEPFRIRGLTQGSHIGPEKNVHSYPRHHSGGFFCSIPFRSRPTDTNSGQRPRLLHDEIESAFLYARHSFEQMGFAVLEERHSGPDLCNLGRMNVAQYQAFLSAPSGQDFTKRINVRD